MNDATRSSTRMLISAAMVVVMLGAVQWYARTRPTQAGEPTRQQTGASRSTSPSGKGRAARTAGKDSKRQLAGFNRLDRRLGARAPTGSGVVVGHVEGVAGDYLPRRNGRYFAGVSMSERSGQSKINNHTEATTRIIYGHKGLAPGVRQVHFYSISDFLGPGMLRTGSAQPPRASEIRLFNHSWISRDRLNAPDVLRRIDYVVDTQDAIMVVGVDNLRESSVPQMLSSAYNVIAVGQGKGRSSGGYTHVEQAGRCKPDVVGPGRLTSYATPVVTSAAARLLETADRHADADVQGKARHAEVIKAVILAGATKPPGWRPEPGRPLDQHLGAGQVDVDRSHLILAAPASQPGPIEPTPGWSFEPVAPRGWHSYELELDRPLADLSLVIVWHRRVQGVVVKVKGKEKTRWLPRSFMADLDLQLLALDEQGNRRAVAQSRSRIDNVEHIYLPALEPGRYRVIVRRADSFDHDWEYALAWWIASPQAGRAAGTPDTADPGEKIAAP